MKETPRSQETAGDPTAARPQHRLGRVFGRTGASSSGIPHRSDGRPPQTPRGARRPGPGGRLGTTPPVPGRPTFLSGRFGSVGPFGSLLPFGAFALCAVLFTLVTWQVVAGGPLRDADERLGRTAFRHGPAWLTESLADLGGLPVAVTVLAVAVGYAAWRGHRARAAAVALAMVAVPVFVMPLKLWTDRTGPLTVDSGYYPSGHTATAMVVYCGAALLLRPLTGHRTGRAWAMPVAVVLSAATGIGLVLRGYHWPLDVLGSWLLCGMLLVLLAAALRWIDNRGAAGTGAGDK
ncbi:phosphatase PAP2 family protein [Streptomyces sp. IB2014 016-6]|nr:phosphatase PAP2 family protein [Streptomyces sp. IB2014 016-6]TXL84958.1 phosphatase PAP2 family protein [Streptomyces sp. IB2014 016-6]